MDLGLLASDTADGGGEGGGGGILGGVRGGDRGPPLSSSHFFFP